jgi:hypothetical protein
MASFYFGNTGTVPKIFREVEVGAMPLALGWDDVALRLVLTLLAGALIGFNRDEHGRPAGLRTTGGLPGVGRLQRTPQGFGTKRS